MGDCKRGLGRVNRGGRAGVEGFGSFGLEEVTPGDVTLGEAVETPGIATSTDPPVNAEAPSGVDAPGAGSAAAASSGWAIL